AFLKWRERSIAQRALPMRALATLLRERSDRYARLATLEMGKPIAEAKAEIEKCAFGCEHFAENAARYLADEEIRANARRSIAELAGRALKKTVLELGGSDPYIVLGDADLEAAAATAVRARNQNNGQSCIAAKRFIVEDSVAAEFERRFAKGVEDLVVGDPMDAKTQVGPLARRDLLDALERQVDES